MMKAAGFEELEHTADWRLRVWAADLAGLLEQAALGMNSLCGIELDEGEQVSRKLELGAPDEETLLVDFLNEVLYFGEQEGLGFRHYFLKLDGLNLEARLEGGKIRAQQKEIKAVTYHDLEIVRRKNGLEAALVFDV
jgi:SHS2 domain-containing protein